MISKTLNRLLTKNVTEFEDKNLGFKLKFPPGWLQSRIKKKGEYLFIEKSTNHGLVIKLHKKGDGTKEKTILSYHKEKSLESKFSPKKININNGYYFMWTYHFEEQKTFENIKIISTNSIIIEWSYCIKSDMDDLSYSDAIYVERDLINAIKVLGATII